MGEKGGWENSFTYFFLFYFVEGNKKIKFGSLEEKKMKEKLQRKKMEKEKMHYKKVILVRKSANLFFVHKRKVWKVLKWC